MIKEKLMKALKTAAADYNGGMGADMAVACAAEAWDFNEKQAERLVEMFNTAVVLNKEKDAEDPTGSCELASKDGVSKILMNGSCNEKKASADGSDYSFYSSSPSKTNLTIEARDSGSRFLMKAASPQSERVPKELDISQFSLYKVIEKDIGILKSAAAAADDVVRNLKIEAEQGAVKIAKAIEHPYADPRMADMFKAACNDENIVKMVGEYSTKVAESDGGAYAKMNVFDSSLVDDLLKIAEEMAYDISRISEYEKKRDFYMSKASSAQDEMLEAVGLKKNEESTLGGMFRGISKKASSVDDRSEAASDEAGLSMKIAEMIRKSGIGTEDVAKLYEDLEKDAGSKEKSAAAGIVGTVDIPSVSTASEALSKFPGIDNERKRIMNVRRAIIVADLLANDPIIRDADLNVVNEAYKTMVMTAPRVSLDKSQVRAFLRSAVTSVAISPADAKVIADVDKGMSLSNVDKLIAMDSSIKDSNRVA